MAGKPVLSEGLPLSDAELLNRLDSLGISMDRDKLAALIQDHCSAEEISRILLKDWRPRSDQKETEFDWGWHRP